MTIKDQVSIQLYLKRNNNNHNNHNNLNQNRNQNLNHNLNQNIKDKAQTLKYFKRGKQACPINLEVNFRQKNRIMRINQNL